MSEQSSKQGWRLNKFRTGLYIFTFMALYLSAWPRIPGGNRVVHAGTNQWTTSGPPGGSVRALAVDSSTKPSTIYASISGTGVYKMTAGGSSWTALNSGLTTNVINCFAVDKSATPSTIYAGTDSGIFRMTSGASSWTEVSNGLVGDITSSLVVDTNTTPNTIYASNSQVFRISSNLDVWTQVGDINDFPAVALAIDTSVNPSIVYAAADGDVFSISTTGTVWTDTFQGLPFDEFLTSLVVDTSTSPSTIYGGAFDNDGALSVAGVFRRKSTETSWTQINTGLAQPQIASLAVDSSTNPSTIYAGSFGGGLFKITSSSSSWTAIASGPTNSFIQAVAIDSSSSPATIYLGTEGGVFAGIGDGNWIEVNNGLRATFVTAIVVDSTTNPSTVYAGTSGSGVFKTPDNGASWIQVNNGLTNAFVTSFVSDKSTNPPTIYAGTLGGVFKIASGQTTWTAVNTGLSDLAVTCLALDTSANPVTVYAGTFETVCALPSGGDTWTPLPATGLPRFPSFLSLTVDPSTNPSTIYAGPFAGTGFTLFKMPSTGTSWTPIGPAIGGLQMRCLVTDASTTPATIYAGTNFGVYKVANTSLGLSPVKTGIGAVNSILLDQIAGVPLMYVGTQLNGVFRMSRTGASSVPFNNGLTNTSVQVLAVDDGTSPHTLYAGTIGGGAFQDQGACSGDMAVIPGTIPGGQIGMPFPATSFAASGAIGAVAVTESGALPTGMSFSGGVLSGKPTKPGAFPITITAIDAPGCEASHEFLLMVFDVCIQDGTTGNMLQFNSQTGDYLFTRCGSSGFTLSGKGTVSIVGNTVSLTVSQPDRKIRGALNLSSLTGSGSVTVINAGTTQTFSLTQTNPHPSCVCPK